MQSAIAGGVFVLLAALITVLLGRSDHSPKNATGVENIEKLLSLPEPRGLQRNMFGAPALDVSAIDYKHGSVDEFHFFGGPSCDTSSQRTRVYSNTFSASQTRCVYVDIGVAIHDTSKDQPVTLHKRFLRPDGTVLCDADFASTIKAGKTRESWVLGCSARAGRAEWPTGRYMVEVSINGALLARGHFEVRG